MPERNVKQISIEDFEEHRQSKGSVPSWQLVAIRKMAIGTAIVPSHEGLVCQPKTKTTQRICSAAAVIGNLSRNSPNKLYKCAHAPNGDIMVACYVREKMAQ